MRAEAPRCAYPGPRGRTSRACTAHSRGPRLPRAGEAAGASAPARGNLSAAGTTAFAGGGGGGLSRARVDAQHGEERGLEAGEAADVGEHAGCCVRAVGPETGPGLPEERGRADPVVLSGTEYLTKVLSQNLNCLNRPPPAVKMALRSVD